MGKIAKSFTVSFSHFGDVSLILFYRGVSGQSGEYSEELVIPGLCKTCERGTLGGVQSLLGQMVSF